MTIGQPLPAAPAYTPGTPPPVTRRRTPRVWWLMAILAWGIALYALSYYVRRSAAFPPDFRASFLARPWGIYSHVIFGVLALALGPFQFRRGILARHPAVHRTMGKIYVVSALMTGVIGFYMALYSFGGLNTHLGFGILGVLTAGTSLAAYSRIRALDVKRHREWMIRSYALIFAAVMLRIWNPLMIVAFKLTLDSAYAIVAWLCWVPNVLWAEWYVRHSRTRVDVPRHSRA